MSQKSTRRSRRQTSDDDSTKSPTPKPEETPPEPQEEPPTDENTSKEATETDETPETAPATPPIEEKMTNGHENNEPETPTKEEEMDPLIVSDDPDPELLFEENSDSGKESPVLNRCKTRRSLTRNIPTPKTPKSVEDTPKSDDEEAQMQEGEENEVEFNASFESCSENVSTKAQVGGDSTRLDYTESNLETNIFLQGTKNKSFGEAMRHLSTRRTIRPIADEYRRRFHLNSEKKDLPYPSRHSVERVSVGIKRKYCSEDEEFTKRFKSDSPGFFSIFKSPLASIRNTFRSDVASSTPKLTGYKDEKFLLDDEGINSKMCEIEDGERRWCSIM